MSIFIWDWDTIENHLLKEVLSWWYRVVGRCFTFRIIPASICAPSIILTGWPRKFVRERRNEVVHYPSNYYIVISGQKERYDNGGNASSLNRNYSDFISFFQKTNSVTFFSVTWWGMAREKNLVLHNIKYTNLTRLG